MNWPMAKREQIVRQSQRQIGNENEGAVAELRRMDGEEEIGKNFGI